jgi:uncharacterized protein (DUF1499 family)
MFEDLNDDNFLIYAMKCFNSPNCVMSEFEGDLKRLKYIKRLIKKYKATGELKERLILNHIIVLSNVFTVEATVRMLFFKFDPTDYRILKPFLLFLSYMPNVVIGIRGVNIKSSDILIDMNIADRLRSI